MSLTTLELTQYLAKLLIPELFEDYAPNGLQIEGKKGLNKIAFAVSATQESLKDALNWGADALIVHHGVFWKHQGAKTITGPWGERIRLALKNDLNLFAYHLPLDSHPEIGNAASLAKELKLKNLAPFALYKKQPLGVKGEFSEELSANELSFKLQTLLKRPITLASNDPNKRVKNIGIITGGANNEWPAAVSEKLDAFLTGEISEYNWHDAIEAGIHYFAGGHHATERFGIIALKDKIQKDFPKIQTQFFDSQNPV